MQKLLNTVLQAMDILFFPSVEVFLVVKHAGTTVHSMIKTNTDRLCHYHYTVNVGNIIS